MTRRGLIAPSHAVAALPASMMLASTTAISVLVANPRPTFHTRTGE